MLNEPQINSPELWLKYFPLPKRDDNKYTRGSVLINGSPSDATGATKLAAVAAMRSGAGMVTVACDEKSLPIYATSFNAIMAKPVKDNTEFFKLITRKKISTVLLGPGNGTTQQTLERVLECLENKNLKIILDADAISVFEKNKNALIEKLNNNCILTPHEGEFRRLFAWQDERMASAVNAAKISNAVIVLKGNETIIAASDGRVVLNKVAPATLASAGTGDVLAGIITGLTAIGMPSFEAACMGVYVHSKCAENLGLGMIADDLPAEISLVLKALTSKGWVS